VRTVRQSAGLLRQGDQRAWRDALFRLDATGRLSSLPASVKPKILTSSSLSHGQISRPECLTTSLQQKSGGGTMIGHRGCARRSGWPVVNRPLRRSSSCAMPRSHPARDVGRTRGGTLAVAACSGRISIEVNDPDILIEDRHRRSCRSEEIWILDDIRFVSRNEAVLFRINLAARVRVCGIGIRAGSRAHRLCRS